MKLWERSRPHLLYDILDMYGGGGGGFDPSGGIPGIDVSGLPPFDPRALPPLVGLPPAGTISIGDLAGQQYPNTTPSPPYSGQTTGAGPMGPSGPTGDVGAGGGGGGGRGLPPLQTPVPPPPDVSGLPPVSRPIPSGTPGSSLPSLTSGIGTATTPLNFLSTLAQNLGKFAASQNQQAQQRGGGGGGYEPVRGGGGLLLPPTAVPQYASGLPVPQPLVLPGGRFDNGGTATAPGLYQMDAGETVRTPQQEQQIQQTIASTYGLGGGAQRAAQPGQQLEDTAAQQAGPPPGGMAFPGQPGQIMQGMQLPQFGDPGAFPKIPGIPETGVTPQQAAGPGVPTQGPFQQMPMPGAFLDKGARTAWTIRDALNNVSQAAGRYQQMQWDKRMGTAQMQAMNEIQKRMQAQQRQPGQIAGQPAQQPPDEVTQAIQTALQTSKDPKEREKLQKMLQQRAKAQEKEAANWAKTLMKAQDPTTPEYIGVQRAYGMMRGMGEQALSDALLKERANAQAMQAQAQYMDAVNKARMQQQFQTGQMGADVAYLQGQTEDTTNLSPALKAMIADAPLTKADKATLMGGYQEGMSEGKSKPMWDAEKEIYARRDKARKISSTASETIMDLDSPTGWSVLQKNADGEDIIDEKTGQPLIKTGANPPRGIETASIHHMKWQDADGSVHVSAITDYRNIPVNYRQRFTQLYGNYPDLMQGYIKGQTTGAPSAAPGGRPAQPGEPGFGSRGGVGASGVTPSRTYPPGGGAQTGTVSTGGDRVLGQGKIPDMSIATLPGNRIVYGTPAQLRLAGVPASSIMKLDASQRKIAESARQMTSKGSLFDLVQDDLNSFKPEELTPLISRWDEWLAGTWGGGAPEKYVRLRTHLNKLLGTAIMQSHVSGGGEAMKNDFETIAQAGKMDKATIQAAFSAERDYIDDRAGRPRIDVSDGQNYYKIPLDQLGYYLNKGERYYNPNLKVMY